MYVWHSYNSFSDLFKSWLLQTSEPSYQHCNTYQFHDPIKLLFSIVLLPSHVYWVIIQALANLNLPVTQHSPQPLCHMLRPSSRLAPRSCVLLLFYKWHVSIERCPFSFYWPHRTKSKTMALLPYPLPDQQTASPARIGLLSPHEQSSSTWVRLLHVWSGCWCALSSEETVTMTCPNALEVLSKYRQMLWFF